MGPQYVGIGGSGSGSGKTTVACRLLARLSGWGAIKVTPTELYSTIIDDPAVLREPGKDTALMLEAGAEEVLWIKAPREGIAEALRTATERLGHLTGVVVEGNSAVEVLRPDVILFIASGSTPGPKRSAQAVLAMADVVLFADGPPGGTPAGARAFSRDDTDGYVEFILKTLGETHERER